MSTDTGSSKWYQAIIDLPLSVFIKVSVDHDLNALVIEGSPDPEDLLKAWESISWQFADATKHDVYVKYTKLKNEVTQLDIDLRKASMLIDALDKVYVERFKVLLNKCLSSKFVFNVHDKEAYDRDLEGARNRMQAMAIRYEMKSAALEEMDESSPDPKPLSREYFLSMLITLSDYSGQRLSDEITVFEFCERTRRMNQYYKKLKQQQDAK